MTTSTRMTASSTSTKRNRPASPPRRRRSPSPDRPPASTAASSTTLTASPPVGAHSTLYQSLFPSDTQLVHSLPLPTLPPPTAKQHSTHSTHSSSSGTAQPYEEKQQLSPPPPRTSPTSPAQPARPPQQQLLTLADVPLVQRENVRLAAELQRATEEREEAADRERQYREQHGREMREVSSSYQHMQFLFEQAKAQITQQQHTIDQLKQQLHHKHSHTASTSSSSSNASSTSSTSTTSHPSFYLNATLTPATPSLSTSRTSPPLPPSPSDEMVELAAQLSSISCQLQRVTQENEWLQSSQSSLIARLQLAQSELKRLKANRTATMNGGAGWVEYVDELRMREREVEYSKLKRDVDWLNGQLQSSQQLIAHYENNSSSLHRPSNSTTTAHTTTKQYKDELDKWKLRHQQSEQDKAKLKLKVEAMEIELFTAEEQRLIYEQQQRDLLATHQQRLEELTVQVQQKDKAVHQLHIDIKAMQAAWEEKERSMQSSWMAAHHVNELRDKVQYLTAVKRESEEERERLKRRIDEVTAELLIASGRHEEEVVSLRKEAIQREDERRQREESEDEKRKDWHRTQVDNARLQGEVDVLSKRCEHYQQEVAHYKSKLADSTSRTSTSLDDEQRLRSQLDAVQSELSLLKAELDSVRTERVRLIEESNSLSMLLHEREEEVRELNDRQTTLTQQLQQRDRDDERKREELEAKGEWTREEAERLIRRQREEVERVKAEMGGVYERLKELRREKAEMYDMLKVCDMQLVKVQLEFKRMEEDKHERQRAVERETEMRQRAEHSLAVLKDERSRADETIQALTRERDEYAVKVKEAQHTLQLVRMEVGEKDESVQRAVEERDRKLAELQLCMRREEDMTAKYWNKEREVRELASQLSQLTWETERCEREVGEMRGEKEKAMRRVEEVETVVRHMDVMSFARDEEVKALMGELDKYRAELMRRVEEVSALKESVEAGKEREDAGRRREREMEAKVHELEREVNRRRDELTAAAKQYEALQQTDGVYRQLIEQLQADVRTLTEEQQAKEREMASQQQQLTADQQTIQQLAHELNTCRSESGALMADLKLLLQENGIVQSKLNTLHERETDHLAQQDAHRHTVESLTQTLTSHEAVIHGLTREVRTAKLDIDRLNLSVAESTDKLLHARQREKAAEADIVRLELEIAKRDDSYRQLCGELDGWKRQNEEMVRLVERLRGELTQQADDQQTHRRELSNIKQLVHITETARADTQRAAAEQLAILASLRDDKERLEREREAVKVECDGLKLRLHHMELLVTAVRRECQTKDNELQLCTENKAHIVAQLTADLQRAAVDMEERGREVERLRVEKERVVSAVRGGASGLQEECVRLTRVVEVLEEDKRRLKGYLLRYEREVKKLEAERDRGVAGSGGGGGGSGSSAKASGGSDAVEAVRRRVEEKEKEDKRDER